MSDKLNISPLINIITAVYNGASTIADCLKSVLCQTILVEHIILDGASTDSTQRIIQRISPCTRFLSEPDRGIYDAMNKGLRLATGDIIGILNADDWYSNDQVLARVAKVFEDPEVEACYGDLVYVQETGARHESRVDQQSDFKILRYWKSGPFNPDMFKWGWMPPHPTFFVRRRIYEKYGLFNLDLGSAADYELMLRFLLKHRVKVAYIPDVLVCMRAGGISNASLKNRLEANRMDRKAWEINGLKPYPWTLAMKPILKIPQWWRRPKGVGAGRE